MSENVLKGFIIGKDAVRQIIEKTVQDQGASFSKKNKERLKGALEAVFEEGKSPKEALKVSDEDSNRLYMYGRTLFGAGKYLDACKVFNLLVNLEPANILFLKSFAVCQHRLEYYQEAFANYIIAFCLDESDLMPLFYGYDCLFKLGDLPFAAHILRDLISRAANRPEYEKLKKQAVLLLECIYNK